MNLVAKDFAAANADERGVLILSEFAGAAEELESAIMVNPYDMHGFARAIYRSLNMDPEERRNRAASLRETVRKNNIYKWLEDFIIECASCINNKENDKD
jgi:trehalose 6-phosphate synthase